MNVWSGFETLKTQLLEKCIFKYFYYENKLNTYLY